MVATLVGRSALKNYQQGLFWAEILNPMVLLIYESLHSITLVERADCRYWLVDQLTGQIPATPPIIKEIWVKRPRQARTVPSVASVSCCPEGKWMSLFWFGMIDQHGTPPRILGGDSPKSPGVAFPCSYNRVKSPRLYNQDSMTNSSGWLAALPVYNEVDYVDDVLDEVARYAPNVLVVDDGSLDGTAERLQQRHDISLIRHSENRGYGAALTTAFQYAVEKGFQGIVTLDCDGQHQPCRIPEFIQAANDADIVSGSRYLKSYEGDDAPPQDRMKINRTITHELNERLGYSLTDAFCGFKAYRTSALELLTVDNTGYAMPLQLWVKAAAAELKVLEIPVPLIYLDLERSFGGSLDQAEVRLQHYREVLDDAFATVMAEGVSFPSRGEVACN